MAEHNFSICFRCTGIIWKCKPRQTGKKCDLHLSKRIQMLQISSLCLLHSHLQQHSISWHNKRGRKVWTKHKQLHICHSKEFVALIFWGADYINIWNSTIFVVVPNRYAWLDFMHRWNLPNLNLNFFEMSSSSGGEETGPPNYSIALENIQKKGCHDYILFWWLSTTTLVCKLTSGCSTANPEQNRTWSDRSS